MSWFKSNWHNQGQQDAAAGKYREPHFFRDSSDADNRAYRDGYFHAKGQQDGGNNEYHSPHFFGDKDDPDNEAYQSSWDSGYSTRK